MLEHYPHIRDLSAELLPALSPIIKHDSAITHSTWKAESETGKAIELLALCALGAQIIEQGKELIIPDIYFNNPDYFYLRNILPYHHGAQAGHLGAIKVIPLKDRFLASLTPKFIIKDDKKKFNVYREGFAPHLIQKRYEGHPEYADRPDILIVQGDIELKETSSEEIGFEYRCLSGQCAGILRVKNDANIPIKSYESQILTPIPVVGLIECSAGKEKQPAEEQLKRYMALFANEKLPVTMIINGRKKTAPSYQYEAYIDMNDIRKSREVLLQKMKSFLGEALL